MEKYSVSYEIERYEVHLYVDGTEIGSKDDFYCEEDAVAYARDFVKKYLNWTAKILRIESAIVEEEA